MRYVRVSLAMIFATFLYTGGVGCVWLFFSDSNSDRPGEWPELGEKPTISVPIEDLQALADANNEFAFKLNRSLIQEGGNVAFSPLSIAMVLDMLYNGAAGETKEAMAATRSLPPWDTERINEANRGLLTHFLWADPDVRLAIANSLWLGSGPIQRSFVDNVSTFYNANVQAVDFKSPNTPALINAWVKEKTNGRITELRPQYASNTAAYAVNTVYFNGSWRNEFKESNTRKAAFATSLASTVNVDMMSGVHDLMYATSDDWQAVGMPYGNGALAMCIVLPSTASSLKGFCDTLDAKAWDALQMKLEPVRVTLSLPRFKLETEPNLTPTLSNLGMKSAFHPWADFSNLSPVPTWINAFDHKVFIEVTEHGTEAAAATGGGGGFCSAGPRTATMTVDRPFFFAIGDVTTGAILFMGAVNDPS
ncbi:MAG: serpin family protein [Planctomycetaceae bacterium]|nr:serpin family protein [Planctomycetaceae bacterium]